MLDVVGVSFCTVVRLEGWDAPVGRYFASYTVQGDFRSLAGQAVINEFATLSSPIFLAPQSLLGKIYDAGISLGHRRDPEMGLDQGWPPLCIGLGVQAPELSAAWQEELQEALSQPFDLERSMPLGVVRRQRQFGDWQLAMVRVAEAAVLATSAPLLPRQLRRLGEGVEARAVVCIATGNRLESVDPGRTRQVRAVSEMELGRVQLAIRELASADDALHPSLP
jgi:hypothetical protein